MSGILAFSAYNSHYNATGSNPYANKNRNIIRLLQQIGVSPDNISYNTGTQIQPTANSIGATVGSKKVTTPSGEEFTLLIVGIRGSGYGKEWAGNVYFGTDGNHTGFTIARDDVINTLREHVISRNITGVVKVWVSGFSRAAATSNFVAAYLIDHPLTDDIKIDPENVFGFCFETPAGAPLSIEDKLSEKYYGIVNIINPNDLVPLLAPYQFGMYCYGREYHLPSLVTCPNYLTLHSAMAEQYRSLAATVLDAPLMDQFKMLKLPLFGSSENSLLEADPKDPSFLEDFVHPFIALLVDVVGTRERFVETVQDPLMDILSLVITDSGSKLNDFCASLLDYFTDTEVATTEDAVTQKITHKLADHGLETLFGGIIKDVYYLLKYLLIPMFEAKPKYLLTVLAQTSITISPHMHENWFSWIAAMDPNYQTNPEINFGSMVMPDMARVAYIHGDIDVHVYSQDTLIGAIEDDKAIPVENTSCIYGLNMDNEKYVIIPPTENYVIKLKPRTDTTLSFGIRTIAYYYYHGCVRNVNWFDKSVVAGTEWVANVPALSENELSGNLDPSTLTDYTLYDPSNVRAPSDTDVSGEEAVQQRFKAAAGVAHKSHGTVTGPAIKHYGEYVRLTAVPANASLEFAGWKNNGTLVSMENPYSVRVLGDFYLEAQFTSTKVANIPNPLESIDSTGNNVWGKVIISILLLSGVIAFGVFIALIVRIVSFKLSQRSRTVKYTTISDDSYPTPDSLI